MKCPGSAQPPDPPVCLFGTGPLKSWCPRCGREYALTVKGRIRAHQTPATGGLNNDARRTTP